jgi:hypothetical protein
MGEIRSTLDIIMVKTNHLTLSDGDKRDQAQTEARQKLQGLVQQFIDGAVRMGEFKDRLAALEHACDFFLDALLLDALTDRLTLAQNGNAVTVLLGSLFDAGSVLAVHAEYQKRLHQQAERREADLRRELREGCHISGSSIKPHLMADAFWQKEVQTITAAFVHHLTRAKAAVTRTR